MQKNLIAGILLILLVALGGWYLLRHKASPAPGGGSTATSTAYTFYCAENRTIGAEFGQQQVSLSLSDGRTIVLPQTLSGSGARYEATTTGADVVFWNKGDSAYLTEDGQTTYDQCTAASIAESDAPGYKTYEDIGKTFTFAFPSDFEIIGTDPGYGTGWSTVATTSGMVLARINVPSSFEPGTNFGQSWFTVGVSSDPASVASCEENLSGNASTGTPVTIGSTKFVEFGFNGAGAGNRYETTSYRTVRDNQCYAIEYTIHYGVLENYPAGTVKEFDRAKITNAFEEMVRSFAFLK